MVDNLYLHIYNQTLQTAKMWKVKWHREAFLFVMMSIWLYFYAKVLVFLDKTSYENHPDIREKQRNLYRRILSFQFFITSNHS